MESELVVLIRELLSVVEFLDGHETTEYLVKELEEISKE